MPWWTNGRVTCLSSRLFEGSNPFQGARVVSTTPCVEKRSTLALEAGGPVKVRAGLEPVSVTRWQETVACAQYCGRSTGVSKRSSACSSIGESVRLRTGRLGVRVPPSGPSIDNGTGHLTVVDMRKSVRILPPYDECGSLWEGCYCEQSRGHSGRHKCVAGCKATWSTRQGDDWWKKEQAWFKARYGR